MTPVNPYSILYPLFAMFLLVTVVLLTMAARRFTGVRNRKISPDYFKLYIGDESPESRKASRNYSNLFEAPILFYVVVILYFITGAVDHMAVTMAWLYVACRIIHSAIHLSYNHVMHRFAAFAASQACLLILWIKWGYAMMNIQTSY